MQQGKQMRFTEDELELIRNTFKGNDKLLKLMRKVFLPEIDPDAPLGQIIDLWMTVPVKEMKPEDALVNILARNQLISHIERQLIQLDILANNPKLTLEDITKKQKQNSSK